MNGQQVGSARLDPGWTAFNLRTYYSSYDVMSFVAPVASGALTLGVELGNGWPDVDPAPWNGTASSAVTLDAATGEAVDVAALRNGNRNAQNRWFDEVEGTWKLGWSRTGATRKFILQLNLEFSDGTSLALVSTASGAPTLASAAATAEDVRPRFRSAVDNRPEHHSPFVRGEMPRAVASLAWTCGSGPRLDDSVYDGEVYDARRETPGWNAPNFHNSTVWVPARPAPPFAADITLTAQAMPLVADVTTFAPVAITNPKPGMYVFDFGQNLAGVCRLSLPGPTAAGVTVQLQHAEVLMHPPYGAVDGTVYTGNLRSALALDSYTTRGSASGESHEFMFTYHGFRYVQVTGLPSAPSASWLTAIHFRSTVAQHGSFVSSSPVLNQIQTNTLWGQADNLMSVPTDCDQRDERKGWMGDAGLTVEEATLNFDVSALQTMFALNIRDSQLSTVDPHPAGSVPDTVPHTFGSYPGDPAWMTAYPSLVHNLWLQNGDLTIVSNHYANLLSYMDFFAQSVASSGLAKMYSYYGDWVPPPAVQGGGQGPKPPGAYISAFAYLQDAQFMVDLAGAMNDHGNVQVFSRLVANLTAEFNAAFFDAAAGVYGNSDGGGLQTAHALALAVNAVPSASRTQVVTNLVNDIWSTHEGHISVGISGAKYLYRMLTENGFAGLALGLAEQTTYPSYGYMFNNEYENATTLWELLDSPAEGPGMNSRNHIMFGSISAYFYTHLAGLTQLAGTTGYAHPVLRPLLTDNAMLTSASATVETVRGNVSVSWANASANACATVPENDVLTLTCTTPGAVIQRIDFASFGTPTGACGASGLQVNPSCNAANSTAVVGAACLGKTTCSVPADDHLFGDPCYGTVKRLFASATCSLPSTTTFTLSAGIPPNVQASVYFPTHKPSTVTITESGSTVFTAGAFVSGTAGVLGATVAPTNDAVIFTVTSGSFSFSSTNA